MRLRELDKLPTVIREPRSWTDTWVRVMQGIQPVSSFLQSLHALGDCWFLSELLTSENFPHLTLLSQDFSACLRLRVGRKLYFMQTANALGN